MRLIFGVFTAAMIAAAPATSEAQISPSRAVPQSRPDQAPRVVNERQLRGPPTPQARTRVRAAPINAFVLRSVVVENSTLAPAVLEAAWRPFVGRRIDSKGLLAVTDALAAAYEANDIAIYTVIVADQQFKDGVLRVRALEGYIDSVKVTGPAGRRNRELIDRYLTKMQADRPLHRSTFQRYISLIRDISGIETGMALKNGTGDAGVELDLAVQPHPVQVGLAINNRGTAYLGRTQVQADVYLNSLLRQGDRTRITIAVPTDLDRFRAYGIEHSQPIGADGLTITANANYLRTRPQGTDILGHAKSVGLQVSYPLIRSYDHDAYATLGVDGVNADNAFLGFRFSDERARAVRGAISYSTQTDRRLAFISATFSQGVDGLGARINPLAAKADFRKFNAKGGASFAFGDKAALRFNAAGQWTPNRLPGTEQFSLGGDEFGRGYAASVIAGDFGFGASAEAALRPSRLPATVHGSEAYAFIDGGKIWYRGRFGQPTDHADLKSAGVGVRVAVKGKAIIQLEATRALGNSIAVLDNRDWRGILSIRSLF